MDLIDPSGAAVRVVADTHELPALPGAGAAVVQRRARRCTRTNATQRPPREPAKVQRLGHVVLQTTTYIQTLDWYLQHLGLIVSDFKYYQGQRERGPTMSFIRCDRGATPTDHHTLAMTLGPANRYVHSAFQVADLDALAAGGEYLREQGFHRSWGIGRHIEGSQIFDYWRDPDGFLVEHFSDGDLFDCTLEPGWSPMTRVRAGPVGAARDQGLPGHHARPGVPARAARDRPRAARRQRVRPAPPARPAESGDVMSISVLRTADAWWVQTPTAAPPASTPTPRPPRELLAEPEAIAAAAASTDTRARSTPRRWSPR